MKIPWWLWLGLLGASLGGATTLTLHRLGVGYDVLGIIIGGIFVVTLYIDTTMPGV